MDLIKENTVYAGHYKIRIKISDNQGRGSIQNLSITVCDCTSKANCSVHSFTAKTSLSAIGIMIFALLLLLGKAGLILIQPMLLHFAYSCLSQLVNCKYFCLTAMFMMALLFCKKQKKTLIMFESVPGYLIVSNTETPGTDCKVIKFTVAKKCQGVRKNYFGR